MIIPVHGDDMIDDDDRLRALYRHTTAPLLLRYAIYYTMGEDEDVRRRPFVDRHAARRGIEIMLSACVGMGGRAGVRAGSDLLRANE